MPESTEQTVNGADIQMLNEPLRARVEALHSESQRALEKADYEREKAITNLDSSLRDKIDAGDESLLIKIEGFKELLEMQLREQKEFLESRIDGLHQLVSQYHLQEQRATEEATAERENAASALRESLRQHIDAQIQQVNQSIESQKVLQGQTFAASEEAISKAERANERRFEADAEFRNQLQERLGQFVLREVFENALEDTRRRQEAFTSWGNLLSNRITEIEAHGVGEKDYAAESAAKSAQATSWVGVGIAAIAVLVTVTGTAINVLGS